ncbi:MAG: MFS transporter [Halothiobacillaceae bacterium]
MKRLLSSRYFLPYFVTQALGALNDNLFRFALMFSLAFVAADSLPANLNVIMNLAAGLFILPFLLFSPLAGRLADRLDKAVLARWLKGSELLLMVLAAIGFWLQAWLFLLALVFFMGTQSALFGPLKYALPPQHLPVNRLPAANGWVAMGTFGAILLGTVGAGWIVDWASEHQQPGLIGMIVVAIALVGLVAAWLIPAAPPTGVTAVAAINPLRDAWRTLQAARSGILPVVLGISWFWFVGSGYLTQFPNFTRETLQADERVGSLLLALFAIGVGSGAVLAGQFTRGRSARYLVPVAALCVAVLGVPWYLLAAQFPIVPMLDVAGLAAHPAGLGLMACIFLTGMAGGAYIVPLYTFLQRRSPRNRRAATIGALNVVNALFMIASALSGMLLFGVLDISLPTFFAVFSATGLPVAWLAWRMIRSQPAR